MSEDWADKTETPTPYRRREARRAGNVARSADLVAAVLALSSVMLLGQYGPRVMEAMKLIVAESLGREAVGSGRIAYLLGTALAPLLAGLTIVAVAANVLQTGFLFIAPKRKDALDPVRGFERIFSGRSSALLAINTLKIVLVAVVAFAVTRGRMDDIVGLQGRSIGEGAAAAGSIVYAIAVRVALVLLLLAIVDFVYQWFRHERELRMTRREVKDELRRLEGDPHTRRRRRDAAAAWAHSRLQRDIAGADVVITDVDRAAIAIAYDPAIAPSPRVVAMGRGTVAQQIRNFSLQHEVPMIDRPALVGAMLRTCQLGRELPARLLATTAELLAYASLIKRKGSSDPT